LFNKIKNLITTRQPTETDTSRTNPSLHLGIWCSKYIDPSCSSDVENLPYHWDDRDKAYDDYMYIQDLKHFYLDQISLQLNAIHRKNYDSNTWNIIIGHWMHCFISVVLDRWRQLIKATSENPILHTTVLDYDHSQFIANSTHHAIEQFYCDNWNHVFISKILYHFPSIIVHKSKRRIYPVINSKNLKKPIVNIVRRSCLFILRNLIKSISYNTRKSNKVLALFSPYLSVSKLIKLAFDYNGKVIYEPDLPKLSPCPHGDDLRQWRITPHDKNSTFEKALVQLIPEWVPTIFLEGFSLNDNNISKYYLKKTDIIFTANAHFNNDSFKIWTARQKHNQSKVIIGLHGGGPPFKFHSSHQHEIEIADLYFVNGNADRRHSHFRSVGQFWSRLDKQSRCATGGALVVSVCMPRYAMDCRSMATASQMPSYFNDQFEFYDNLGERIQQNIKVRLYPNDYGWNQEQRWRDRFPIIKFDFSRKFEQIVRKMRIVICTYNATTYNQTISANIPTLIYWNPNHWQVADQVEKEIDAFRSVGVFHQNPVSAAKFLESIWDKIEDWWFDSRVQQVREDYCMKYAMSSSSSINKMCSIFNGLNCSE
jgi:putative transferase (TIGR04331 family)